MSFKPANISIVLIVLLMTLLPLGCDFRPYEIETEYTFTDEDQIKEDAETEEIEVRVGGAPNYTNHNVAAVQNGGTPPRLEVKEDVRVTSIETYHWNDGTGTGVTGTISIQGEDGTVYGPFETTGSEGQGGVPNAYWTAEIDIDLPPGTYTVLDSDPGTWAQNGGSGGKGMIRVETEPPPES